MQYLSNEFLIRLLIFIIIFALSFQIVRKTLFKDKILSSVISITLSLIAAFYISPSQLDFITNSYGAAGILIILVIPYLIVFYLIYVSKIPSVLRKTTILFMGIITFAIIQNNEAISTDLATKALMILIVITLAFLLSDKKIQNYFNAKKNLKGI